jgi:branched-subunit amino acid aminotransferase/4-amino-4-deoxychorismate lyase
MRWAWLNGQLIPQEKACLLQGSGWFLSRQGLFETMRCYQGRVFLADEHIQRLIKSCPLLGIKAPKRERLKDALRAVIEKNHFVNASLRLDVFKQPFDFAQDFLWSPFDAGHGFQPWARAQDSAQGAGTKGRAPQKGIGIFVFSRKLPPLSRRQYKKGFSVMLEKRQRIVPSPLNNVKSLDRYFYDHLTQVARQRGFHEAFFLNVRGEVVEGARTNVFLVKGGKVSTPMVSCGCLPGVTRAKVISLLKKLKIPVFLRRIYPRELFFQEEIFVTNSLLGVMPVMRLDKKPVKSAERGTLTKKLMAVYQIEVEKACLLG